MQTEFLCISVLRVASGPSVKLASCKSALKPSSPSPLRVVYSIDRSKAVVPVLVLLFCGLFLEAICCMSYLVLFCSCVFSHFRLAITSFEEERANLSAFRTFVRFVLVWICRFPLPLSV